MIPIYQSKYGTEGDCLRCSLASLLHLRREAVPHFMPNAEDLSDARPQSRAMLAWLKERGLYLMEITWPANLGECSLEDDRYVLATVKSQLGNNYTHAVVGLLQKEADQVKLIIAHDPDDRNYGRREYVCTMIGFLVALWPYSKNQFMSETQMSPAGKAELAVAEATNAQVIETKKLRVGLDAQLQRLKDLPPSRERSLSITKIQEAIMWLGMDLKRLNDTRPYPSSYDPTSTKVEPTADGLKL